VVNGFSGGHCRGFRTLSEAEDYMHNKGVTSFKHDIKYDAGDTTPRKNQKAYYAVANGRTPGIQEYYYGRNGTEPEVATFSGACHKRFRTKAQAKSFISDWIEMFACVAKANIRSALLDGPRPVHMQEWSLQFEWKKDTEDDRITDDMERLTLGR